MNNSPNHGRVNSRWRGNQVERGKCAYCTADRMRGLTSCREHRDAGRAASKARDTFLRAHNLCRNCQQPVVGAYRMCASCLTANAAYQREWRARPKRIRWGARHPK